VLDVVLIYFAMLLRSKCGMFFMRDGFRRLGNRLWGSDGGLATGALVEFPCIFLYIALACHVKVSSSLYGTLLSLLSRVG
jgi:hypothetical protein